MSGGFDVKEFFINFKYSFYSRYEMQRAYWDSARFSIIHRSGFRQLDLPIPMDPFIQGARVLRKFFNLSIGNLSLHLIPGLLHFSMFRKCMHIQQAGFFACPGRKHLSQIPLGAFPIFLLYAGAPHFLKHQRIFLIFFQSLHIKAKLIR
jgi:hypothetical protein